MLVSQGAASPNACDRDYAHLHFVRAFLLCLGFLLHAALFCTAGGDAFQALYDLIHSFRMESFFVIAGFFSARTLGRKSPRVFLLRRYERLGVPLIFCTIVFTVLNHLLPSLGIRSAWIVVPEGPVRADLASHLWFLRTLVILVSAMFVLRVARPGLDSWLKEFRVTPAVFLVSLAGANFLGLHWTHGLHPEYWHLPHLISNLDSAIIYTPWFAAGYILFHHEDLLERIASLLLFNTLNIGAFLLLRPSLEGTVFGHYLAQAWQGAFIVSVFGLLFWCSRRFFGNPPAGVQAVANASYTMYLFHWPVMATLRTALFSWARPGFPLFCALTVLTGISSYCVHAWIVRRSRFCAWLLNGVPLPGGKPWTYLRAAVTA